MTDPILDQLLERIAGTARAQALLAILVAPELSPDARERVSRAVIAQALAMLLFEGLLTRVPSARGTIS